MTSTFEIGDKKSIKESVMNDWRSWLIQRTSALAQICASQNEHKVNDKVRCHILFPALGFDLM
jgi:hypothetical protein